MYKQATYCFEAASSADSSLLVLLSAHAKLANRLKPLATTLTAALSQQALAAGDPGDDRGEGDRHGARNAADAGVHAREAGRVITAVKPSLR